ncbi:hypothetical protein PoB_000257300 [Plakobranchus ocellatus]|uniref:Uncharacterized protein n=1 Tax=Plakobranchus ocellatus TaxID=259542 RepID=A0AAV3Y093_9GAST|nr:hypothetical protein PoB_000257300 [Plakobranchus ocellatus]
MLGPSIGKPGVTSWLFFAFGILRVKGNVNNDRVRAPTLIQTFFCGSVKKRDTERERQMVKALWSCTPALSLSPEILQNSQSMLPSSDQLTTCPSPDRGKRGEISGGLYDQFIL